MFATVGIAQSSGVVVAMIVVVSVIPTIFLHWRGLHWRERREARAIVGEGLNL